MSWQLPPVSDAARDPIEALNAELILLIETYGRMTYSEAFFLCMLLERRGHIVTFGFLAEQMDQYTESQPDKLSLSSRKKKLMRKLEARAVQPDHA